VIDEYERTSRKDVAECSHRVDNFGRVRSKRIASRNRRGGGIGLLALEPVDADLASELAQRR